MNELQLKELLLKLWNTNVIFRDNLAFLSEVSLRNFPPSIRQNILNLVEDFYRYDLLSEFLPPPIHILNAKDSLELILENPKSFCRFGDGELQIIAGNSIPFQEYDSDLSARLREILQSSNDKCYVGINHAFFSSTSNLIEREKNFYRGAGYFFRSILLNFCNKKRLYIDSTFTNFYIGAKEKLQNYQSYFEGWKNLFKNRKLIIFSGKSVFDKISPDIFEYAAERKHIFADSKNAWRQYSEIMAVAKIFPKDVTMCFILGPAATVLAWDLAQEGYTAWDIGHVAKDYDAFQKKIDNVQNKDFYNPD